MTKPELQASERALRAAEFLSEHYSFIPVPLPVDEVARQIEHICHLRELEAVVSAVRKECAKFNFPDEDRPELWEALKSLDAAKEGK